MTSTPSITESNATISLSMLLNVSTWSFLIEDIGYCHPPDHLLDDSCLERVESFKYLGILLSSDLSWSEHIESICTKASKLLYHKFYKHAELPALFQLYLSLVRPHLEYASDVWTPPTKGQNTY